MPTLARQRLFLGGLLTISALGAATLGLVSGCKSEKSATESPAQVKDDKPSLRLFALGGVASAIEPCGCVEDMLGGVDHAASFISKSGTTTPGALVVGAGPMFFMDPFLVNEKLGQYEAKATTLADSLNDMGLVAWAPGANDWAAGVETFDHLRGLTGARALAANLTSTAGGVEATQVLTVGGVKVGLAGVSVPMYRGGKVPFEVGDARKALESALAKLEAEGAELRVALIAAPRGEAMRLVEFVDGFQVAVLGKSFDQGDTNETEQAPAIIGKTLIVQGQNHLQSVAVVDLFVRGESFAFEDGSGLESAEQRTSYDGRIDRLQRRIAGLSAGAAKQSAEAQLAKLRTERAQLPAPTKPEAKSYFTYELVKVRESQGVDPAVGKRLLAYYQRINTDNEQRFADRKPQPVGEGQRGYVGIQTCSGCHPAAREVWNQTSHGRAYETLVKEHKQFNLDCVSCHVTGYERPGGSTVTHVEGLSDVQCEVCHGPGSEHVKNPGVEGSIELLVPNVCSDCHHAPHVHEDWSMAEAMPHILGPGHGKPMKTALPTEPGN